MNRCDVSVADSQPKKSYVTDSNKKKPVISSKKSGNGVLINVLVYISRSNNAIRPLSNLIFQICYDGSS